MGLPEGTGKSINAGTQSVGTQDSGRGKRSAFILWWIAPLVGLLLVLFAAYQAVTVRSFDNENSVTGELLTGTTFGQSFVARYDNLSGVELHIGTFTTTTAPARASLIVHLRQGSEGQESAGPDIATAELPAGTSLTVNSWYLFSFPPVHDSQDHPFYIEIESPDGARDHALALFWWVRNPLGPNGDPYAQGVAYQNGKALKGDFSFKLHYQASPFSAVGQIAQSISNNMPLPLLLLFLMGALAGICTLLYLLLALRDRERRRRWLRRWSLPFVLSVALLNGLLYLCVVPLWQGPDEQAHFAYAALLDRFDLDYTRMSSVYPRGQTSDEALADAINASMDRYGFTHFIAGDPEPGAAPDAGANLFSALGKPPTYYWLGVVVLRLARMAGIDASPYSNPDVALLVLRGVTLALGLVVLVMAWLAARIISPDGGWLILLLPLTVALFPMHAFDTSVFENDVLAEIAVSALFVALAALLRWPTGWRGVGLAALSILCVLGAIYTKSTADASLPLLAGGLLVWMGLLVTQALKRRAARRAAARNEGVIPVAGPQSSSPNQFLVPGIMLGALVLLGLGFLFTAYEPQDVAAGWITSWTPFRPVPHVVTSTAHQGSYVLELGPKGRQATVAVQTILQPVYHPVLTTTVTAWVRTAPGAGKPLVLTPTAILTLQGDATPFADTEVPLGPGNDWQVITATAHVPESAQRITLQIRSVNQRAQFDDFTLKVDDGTSDWHDPIYRPVLINSSAEMDLLGLRSEFADRLPANVVDLAAVMANPQPFDKLALWARYANGEFTSFWGNFGWLSLPLPESLYGVLLAVCVLSLVGLTVRAVRRLRRYQSDLNSLGESSANGWATTDWLGFVALLTLIATVVVSYAWQTTQLATRNVVAGLSGRYLFVLIVPIVLLLLAGLDAISSLLSAPLDRFRHASRHGDIPLPWAIWLYMMGLTLFAAYCLFALIVPFYYG